MLLTEEKKRREMIPLNNKNKFDSTAAKRQKKMSKKKTGPQFLSAVGYTLKTKELTPLIKDFFREAFSFDEDRIQYVKYW